MNDEMLRLSLIDFMNNDVLNDFVNTVFRYRLKEDEYVYIQYKIVNDNIVMNIFDNGKKNRFRAYIFTLNDIINEDKNVFYINVNSSYKKYKSGYINKLYLLGALLKAEDIEEKKKIIDILADNKIKDILLKNFTI